MVVRAVGRSAVISTCGKYRYSLRRRWTSMLPHCVFIMLNPSTADAHQDDPTIRRCMGYADAWNFGGIVVVNLFAYRATDPKALRAAADPIGPENDAAICRAVAESQLIVAAWGEHGSYQGRSAAVRAMLASYEIKCLKQNASGEPKHPLYCRKDIQLVPLTGS